MLPAASRLAPFNLEHLLAQRAYFTLHAPRQTGKTTAMLALACQLTAAGNYVSVLVTMEVGSAFPDDIGMAEDAILGNWRQSIRFQLPEMLHPPVWTTDAPPGQRISDFLSEWSLAAPRPLVVLLDEIDALQDHILISVLRQLRSGFSYRPAAFPSSIALIGLRDVRDYKVKSGGSPHPGTSSPFNIAAGSFTLRNFSITEVQALLDQHTAATGQAFSDKAQARIWELTQGQPWLVNALARICVEELTPSVSLPIGICHIHEARERLIQRRQTHIDQLADKLREERVRRIIAPILAGDTLSDMPQDDLDYAADLGLVRYDNGNSVTIANPIYGEVIPRELAGRAQASLPTISPVWLHPDGSLNPEQLLEAFLAFWRQHGQPLLQSVSYHKLLPIW